MIQMRILRRTFFIKGARYGTAFTIDVNKIEYLVTAKHLLDQKTIEFELLVFKDEKWSRLSVTTIGHGIDEVDVSVLRPASQLTPAGNEIALSTGDLALGQDMYFIGYPYKMWSDGGSLMGGLPLPFAKKGALSALNSGPSQTLYLDAINNEGFSGGPLFYYPVGKPNDLRVAGIVSKFRVEHEAVLNQDGDPTGMTVPYNTGFLVAYSIKHVLELIRP